MLLVIVIAKYGSINYCWYIAVMHLSLEILNSRSKYLSRRFKIYNSIFWCYELVLLKRLRTSYFSEQTEFLINCAEHILFGVIICLKIYIYTVVFSKRKITLTKRAIITVLIFNIIGLINEIFQNYISNRSLFIFIEESIKDIKMNLGGSFIFLLFLLCRTVWTKNKGLILPEK